MSLPQIQRDAATLRRAIEAPTNAAQEFSAGDLARFDSDFPYFAERCLKIRTKSRGLQPFILNRVQRRLHERIEDQLRRKGRVRKIILKARQPGVSTYIQGRFYWKLYKRSGARAFVLTHEQDATDNIFDMTQRFHDNCPAQIRPATKAANAKELDFAALDSGYRVATAGTKTAGRSQTIQLFHWSEVAFCPNAEDHAAGSMQAVPEEDSTEILMESTAEGMGGFFHLTWKEAEGGDSQFEGIFFPWFEHEEYVAPVPTGFTLSEEDQKYRQTYSLTLEQMAWRADKLKAPGMTATKFMQEYPSNATEAFQVSGGDTFIKSDAVIRARKQTIAPDGALIVGVDPAGMVSSKPDSKEGDKFAIIRRRTRTAYGLERLTNLTHGQKVALLKKIIDEEKPAKMCIDVGGGGDALVSDLRDDGYGSVVEAVNFGGAPIYPGVAVSHEAGRAKTQADQFAGGPKNRRAEIWLEMRKWLSDEAVPVQIPDDDLLHGDLCGPFYREDANQKLLLESKDDMKDRGLKSPDSADALALTFAVRVSAMSGNKQWRTPMNDLLNKKYGGVVPRVA